jgi:hypothetical protein
MLRQRWPVWQLGGGDNDLVVPEFCDSGVLPGTVMLQLISVPLQTSCMPTHLRTGVIYTTGYPR